MTECDLCTDFTLLERAVCDEKSFRARVLRSLCYINEVLGTQEVPATLTTYPLTQLVKTASEVQADYASYANIPLVTSNKKLNYIRIVNTLDVDLDFSFDSGVTTAFTVLANTTYIENLNITLATTTSFRMKRAAGSTADLGKVIIEGRYLA